jgi:hypothetical protein
MQMTDVNLMARDFGSQRKLGEYVLIRVLNGNVTFIVNKKYEGQKISSHSHIWLLS